MAPKRSLLERVRGKRPKSEESEEELESKGNIYKLQHYRFKKGHRDKIPEFLQLEFRIREITQRKLALTKVISQAPVPTERTEQIEKEVLDLKEKCFLMECETKLLYDSIDYKPLKNALKLWRSHPQWYLHRTLTQDCIDRGGCCGRPCGCCQSRKAKPSHKFSVGHCTVECGCCQEDRGYELTEEGKNRMREIFLPDNTKNYAYYRKIMLASVYGLLDGSTKNPFDLIDQPPGYE